MTQLHCITCNIFLLSSFKTVDVEDLESSDLISINTIEDLMPIVLENSQYETTVTDNGLKHSISYNLGLLQKKVQVDIFV